MAQYQWTGNAGTGDFGTPANWEVGAKVATAPPGPSDDAVIDTTDATITGNGTAYRLIFEGTEAIVGELTATYGSQANGQTALTAICCISNTASRGVALTTN